MSVTKLPTGILGFDLISFGGLPARKWLDGVPPKCFEFVGNIPPSKAEAEMECLVHYFSTSFDGDPNQFNKLRSPNGA